jgi:hypothetical protein
VTTTLPALRRSRARRLEAIVDRALTAVADSPDPVLAELVTDIAVELKLLARSIDPEG